MTPRQNAPAKEQRVLTPQQKVDLTIKLHRQFHNLNPIYSHGFEKQSKKIKYECIRHNLDYELIQLPYPLFECVLKKGDIYEFVNQ